MKITTLLPAAGLVLLQLLTLPTVPAADPKPTAGAKSQVAIPPDDANPSAVIVSLQGKCDCSLDGLTFTPLTSHDVFTLSGSGRSGGTTKSPLVLHQGTVVRAGKDSRIDIFFRRIGTTVRLQPDTEVKFETVSRSPNSGVSTMETVLELRSGRIFTVVRSVVSGSVFAIRNAAGRSVVEGAPAGTMDRYIITADGTQVAEKSSQFPLKLIGEKRITVIAPGQKFDAKEGKLLPVAMPESVAILIEFDELHALMETTLPRGATPPQTSK